MNEGYQLVAHRAVFVRFPLRGRPGENLLVWTTTPWTLTSNVAAAVNPTLTYLKVKHKDADLLRRQGRLHGPAAGRAVQDARNGSRACPSSRRSSRSSRRRAATRSSARSPAPTWSAGPTTARSTNCRPSSIPPAIPARSRDVVAQAELGAGRSRPRELHRVIAWKDVGETEGTGIVHIAPGCGKEDFHLGKEQGLPPVAPLDDSGVFLPGFGELDRQVRRRSRHHRLDPRQPADRRACCSRSRSIRTAIRTAGAARRSCCSASSMSGSST